MELKNIKTRKGRPMRFSYIPDQQQLVNRLKMLLVNDPNRLPMYKLYKVIGVSLTCLTNFIQCSRETSMMQLMKIQKYILDKEKELGL